MVHLPPLPGSPRWRGSMEDLFRAAVRDAASLAAEGVDGILVENFGDAPFHPREVPPVTVAAMAVLLRRLRGEVATAAAWGVNVLRNDAAAALAIAAATGAAFIRVNVHTGVQATDQGLLEGRAHETVRLREALAPHVAILADARVKHARPVAQVALADEVRDLVERGLADAICITGARTGLPPSPEDLREAREAAGETPVIAASGIDAGSVRAVLRLCDGVIVGTSLKRGGRTDAVIERRRVRRLVEEARS